MVMNSSPQSAQAAGAALDRAVAKVGLMIDYVRHASGVTDQDARERMEDRARTFRELLQKSNVTAIAEATRVLQQIRDDVYPEGVRQRLGKNQARIEADPPVVYEHIPMQFSIRFFEPAIDRAMAARGDFHCEWAFGDDLTERGWEITHYYMIRKGSEETFTVKATFTDILGDPEPGERRPAGHGRRCRRGAADRRSDRATGAGAESPARGTHHQGDRTAATRRRSLR
jgi:hypothetical protein